MDSRDPEPGGAPEGEPDTGRLPAAPFSFEQAAERFAELSGRLSAERFTADQTSATRAAAEPVPEPAADPAADSVREPVPADQLPGGAAVPAARPTRRAAWRAWRGTRPFLGGVLMTLGGAEILLTEKASIGVVIHIGMEGLSGYLIPVMLLVCGLLTIFNPAQRMFYSVLGVLLSLGSWVTSNLGGFFVGLLLGVLGGCLAFGWLPDQEPRGRILRRPRRASVGEDTAHG